ncbi:YcdB/YcdC domain-containing protein [Brevibacillus sp. NRS-1366]|uniref:YcdB/YcdC domain-containing protein n=1 Tax=Brevibacillus sp. NRS-1366 TaxID=3233899 RepID=UPI003D21FF1D
MKKRSKAVILLLAASAFTTPGLVVQPVPVIAYDGKSSLEPIELPSEVIDMLEHLKESYLPAVENLHVDSFGNRGSSYILNLSDRKSIITENISLKLVMDGSENISLLKFTDEGRDKKKRPNKQQSYKKAIDFIRDHFSESHLVSSQAMLTKKRGSAYENLVVVPFYPVLNDVRVTKEMGQAMVDADGQIVLFQQTNEKVPLASAVTNPKQAIAEDKAKQAFAGELEMELVYDTAAGGLVYQPKHLAVIDAVTGEIIPSVTVESSKTMNLKGSSDGLSWKNETKLEQMLEKEFGLLANTLKYDHVTEKNKNSDIDVYEWTSRMYQSASFILDRKTGLPIEVKVEGTKSGESKRTLDEAESEGLAVQFVEKYLLPAEKSFVVKKSRLIENLPGWVDQNRVHTIYSYRFHPQVEGIPTKEPVYSIDVDAQKGIVVRAEASTLPSLPTKLEQQKLVDEAQAKQAFLGQAKVSLAYWYPKVDTQTAALPQLVYLPSSETLSTQIHAATGEAQETWLEWKDPAGG